MTDTPASDPPPTPQPQPVSGSQARAPGDIPDRRPAGTPRLPTAIAVLALIVSCAAAGFAFWQALLARHALIESRRAFVSVSGPQVAAVFDSQDNTLKSVGLTVLFANSGRRPTRDMNFFVRCVTAGTPQTEPWGLLFQDRIEKQPLVIGPQGSATAQCAFSGNQIREMSEGKLHGYVLGDITYHDRRNGKTLRRTQFSWRITDIRIDPASKTVALTAAAHGQHNCADEQCPLAIMTH